MALTRDQQKELIELTRQQNELKKRGGELDEEQKARLEELLALTSRRLESLKEEQKLTQELADAYKRVADINKGNADIQLVYMEQQKLAAQKQITILGEEAKRLNEKGELTDDILEKNMKLVKEQEQLIANLDTQIKLTEEWHATIDEAVKISRDLGKSLGKAMAMPKTHDFVGNMQSVVKHLQGGKAGWIAFGHAAASAISAQFVNNVIGMAVAVVDVEAGFQRATGASKEFSTSVRKSYDATKEFGVTAEEASKAAQALYTSYTDFTFMAESQREALIKTTSLLAEQGVAVGDVAKGTQIASKMMGMSAGQIEATHREINTFARELGVAPAQMAAEFAKGGTALAKFGDQGVRVFKDLQHISKITGMEMDKVLQITNKFDTFEGAAEQAGKLNAALGGNFVNAMDLMMGTDPAERFETIRNTILDAGLSFDTMSYYQKNYYKDALGLSDVGDLALVLSGNMDTVAGATQKSAEHYEDMAKRTLAMQSIQDKFSAAIADSAPMIEGLIEGIKLLTDHMHTMGKVLKVALPTMLAIKSVMIAWGMARGILNALLATQLILTKKSTFFEAINAGAKTNSAIASGTLSGALQVQEKAQDKVNKGSYHAAAAMAAFGAAALGIGAGIALAAVGLSKLVLSFKDLGSAALPAAIGIGLFTFAFMKMMLALAAMVTGPQAVVAAGAVGLLLAVGGAAALIGGAVWLAADGLANLLTVVGEVGVGTFMGMALGLAMTAGALQLFALPWMGIAIMAFGSFGVVLTGLVWALGKVVEPATKFFTSLAALSTAKDLVSPFTALVDSLSIISTVDLSNTATQIQNIVAEVNKLDKAKAMQFTTAMKTVTTAIVEVKNTPAPVLNEIATGVGKTTTGPTTLVANITLSDTEVRNLIREGSTETFGELISEAIG